MLHFKMLMTTAVVFYGVCATAQPGFESVPIHLWIWDNENTENRQCNNHFEVTAEFFIMAEVSNGIRVMHYEKLQCRFDTVQHQYYDEAWGRSTATGTERIPTYYHSGLSPQGEEYILQSITITSQDGERMKLFTMNYHSRDYIYYSNGNSVHIPTIVYFKPGEFYHYELQEMGEVQRIKEKYQQSTSVWHKPATEKRTDTQYLKKLKAGNLSIGTGHVMVKVSTSQLTPMNSTTVTAHFDDGTAQEFTQVFTDKTYTAYLYTADPNGLYAAVNIKSITADAMDYNGYAYYTEEIVPHSTIEEVTLFRVNEDFIYHSGFQRLPLHTDYHYLGVYFPDNKNLDTTGFALWLLQLELVVDTVFNYCYGYSGPRFNSMLLKKNIGNRFETEHCQELGFLRNEFPQIVVCPKLYLRVQGNDGNRKDFFQLITNRMQVFYHTDQPAMKELFDEIQLPYTHNTYERYYELTLPVTSALGEMIRVSELLKESGLFTGVEHQYYPVWCY
ncbi:MAG: hypothetical protein ACKVOR_14465 [Flavobacteriales bacterium]